MHDNQNKNKWKGNSDFLYVYVSLTDIIKTLSLFRKHIQNLFKSLRSVSIGLVIAQYLINHKYKTRHYWKTFWLMNWLKISSRPLAEATGNASMIPFCFHVTQGFRIVNNTLLVWRKWRNGGSSSEGDRRFILVNGARSETFSESLQWIIHI